MCHDTARLGEQYHPVRLMSELPNMLWETLVPWQGGKFSGALFKGEHRRSEFLKALERGNKKILDFAAVGESIRHYGSE